MMKGKKRLFFSFLLSLILPSHRSDAQTLKLLSSSLMNFPRFRALTFGELKHRPFEIHSRFVYNDFYRKQSNGKSVLTWDGLGWEIDSFVPVIGTRFRFGVNLFYRGSQTWFQNRKDHTALYAQDHTVRDHGGFQLALSDGRGMLGAGLERYSAQFQTPIWIRGFPTSKNGAVRSYFLDWIEPTFGRQLNITGGTELQKPILFVSIPTFRGKRISLFFGHSRYSSQPEVWYTNSSNRFELTGNRKIGIPFELKENLFDVTFENEHASSKISVAFFDTRFAFHLDNNPPETAPIRLDFDRLGKGSGGRSGFSVGYSRQSKSYLMQIGLGRAHYFGAFDLRTPVLGYFDNLFPISHGVKGKITGNSFSQMIEAGFIQSIYSAVSLLKLGYTHGFFDLNVNGDALLEFNLVSVPVHHPLHYHVHLVEINWRLERRFGPFVGFYSFEQFIPFVVRSDTSPIHLSERVEGVTTASRGGAVHQLVISYQR